MSNESIIRDLLNGTEFDDPRLYDALNKLLEDFYKVFNQLYPPTASSFGKTGQVAVPGDILGFTATLFANNCRLTWYQSSSLDSYEIRYKSGAYDSTYWDASEVILVTGTQSADINPLTIPLLTGNHTFLIKGINTSGEFSKTASYVVVNIPLITAPTISITVITNFVLLSWSAVDSVFAIAYYNIYKNNVLQGKVSGTFEAIFETVGGNFTYVVEPVDIVGNVGLASTGVTVAVSNPVDFTLHSTLISTFTGTKTNCFSYPDVTIPTGNVLIACINATETYDQHFSTRSWISPQSQVDAGYPIVIEPSQTSGQYQEVFDFGSVISNIIVVMDWNVIAVVGSISTGSSTIETSTDNISWTAPVVANSKFAAAIRYVRFTMKFVGTDTKSLSYYYNLRCLLNVHREQDGAQATVFAVDAGGTVVNFNKAFKSIDSITLTPVNTLEQKAVYDFSFPVNPTSFKILLFNTAGARINGNVTWLARGIF